VLSLVYIGGWEAPRMEGPGPHPGIPGPSLFFGHAIPLALPRQPPTPCPIPYMPTQGFPRRSRSRRSKIRPGEGGAAIPPPAHAHACTLSGTGYHGPRACQGWPGPRLPGHPAQGGRTAPLTGPRMAVVGPWYHRGRAKAALPRASSYHPSEGLAFGSFTKIKDSLSGIPSARAASRSNTSSFQL